MTVPVGTMTSSVPTMPAVKTTTIVEIPLFFVESVYYSNRPKLCRELILSILRIGTEFVH